MRVIEFTDYTVYGTPIKHLVSATSFMKLATVSHLHPWTVSHCRGIIWILRRIYCDSVNFRQVETCSLQHSHPASISFQLLHLWNLQCSVSHIFVPESFLIVETLFWSCYLLWFCKFSSSWNLQFTALPSSISLQPLQLWNLQQCLICSSQ